MAKSNVTKKTAPPSLSEKAAKLPVAAIAGILLGIAVVLSGAFYGLVYMPYKDDVARLESAIRVSKKNVDEQAAALNKHNAVGVYNETIAAAYQYIKRYLPQEEEMPRLVQMVSEIASRAGLTDGVTLFAPKLPAIIQDNYAEIPFTMNLEGEFLTVLSFLYDFSRMDRIVNITDIQIGSPKMVDERRELFHVQVKCAGSTYRSLTESEIEAQSASAGGRRRL